MPATLDPETILQHLDHVLASAEFTGATRLQAFLRFIVQEDLAGRGAQLKETLIASNVYGRPVDYDPRIDSVVRVDASKLRQRLSQYYAIEGALDPLRISVPKGSYHPLVEFTQSPPSPKSLLWRNAFFVAVTLFFGVGILSWQRLQQPAAPNLMRLRTERLTEASAFSNSITVSQDGSFVVYSSDRDGGGLLNLWRQPLNGGTHLRLTSGKFNHEMPTLSPDGKTLIFRIDQNGGTLARMPASGGPEERIRNSEGGRDPRFSPKDSRILYWIPADEHTIDYGRVFLARLESISSIAPSKLFGDFAHAARPIWSDKASHVLALGTWQSNIPDKEFDAWLLEVQGINSKGAPKKTGLFPALKQAGLSPPLSLRPLIEVGEWSGGWLYITVPAGESMDLFRIRLRPEKGVVEGPFERITAGMASGFVGGHRMAGNGDMVFVRQESSSDLFSVEVPSSGKVSEQLRKHNIDSGRISRPVVHPSGTVGAWELRGNSPEEKPWFLKGG